MSKGDTDQEMILNGEQENGKEYESCAKEEDKALEEELLNHVARSKAIVKSQQKGDPDLTVEEKLPILGNILRKSHCLFLSKFGHYLKPDHLKYFEKSREEDYEVSYHINRLQRFFNNSTRQRDVKNRRYQALKALIEKGEYFSETEMMKRNPLMYEHLVGQYMTEKQIKERDTIDPKKTTFVNILMEGIERHGLKEKQKQQEEEERNVLEENDSDEESDDPGQTSPRPTSESGQQSTDGRETNQWSEVNELKDRTEEQNSLHPINKTGREISTTEKQILKQEFVSNMYQSFLDGKDTDFDYSTVDDNEAYDNIELRTQDEEEKYFDSEPPETVSPAETQNENESEDELDIYMKSLKEGISANAQSLDNQT